MCAFGLTQGPRGSRVAAVMLIGGWLSSPHTVGSVPVATSVTAASGGTVMVTTEKRPVAHTIPAQAKAPRFNVQTDLGQKGGLFKKAK